MVLVVTVRCALTTEIVALHATSKTLTAAHRGDIDDFTSNELVHANFLAHYKAFNRIQAQLDQTTTWGHVVLGKMASGSLVEFFGIFGAISDLQRAVAIRLFGLDLHDAQWLDAQHGHGHNTAILRPHLRHADLFADDRFLCHGEPFLLRFECCGTCLSFSRKSPARPSRRSP